MLENSDLRERERERKCTCIKERKSERVCVCQSERKRRKVIEFREQVGKLGAGDIGGVR